MQVPLVKMNEQSAQRAASFFVTLTRPLQKFAFGLIDWHPREEQMLS